MRFLFLLAVLGAALAAENWKTLNVDRTIDISTQIVKISTLYVFENAGTAPEKILKVALTAEEEKASAFISVHIEGNKGKLKITKDASAANPGFAVYNVDLRNPIKNGEQVKIRVNLRLTHVLEPLPAKIKQSENQFVVYEGSAYIPSPYVIGNQKTLVKLATGGKTLSAVGSSKQETGKITYGPYQNIGAFETKPLKVHAENNSPFVVATVVERLIEVSHWGNIAVEEYIEIIHKGAELDSPFSRIDYQMDRRGNNQPAFQHFTTILPPTARDIYYRDEIGNISTSAVRIRANSVDLEIRPRFPLFGGWKTSYVIGYNLPSHEYLYNKGNQYALKIKLFDHVFDNIVVEKLTTKIVLPEHVKKVKITTPYPVERRPDEVNPTYLDTVGRLVVIVTKNNLISEHSQFFTLSYEFEFTDMLREPAMAIMFFLVLFSVVIIYARFDFTISPDPEKEAAEKIQCELDGLAKSVEAKQAAYEGLIESALEFKGSKDAKILSNAKTKIAQVREKENERLEGRIEGIREGSAKAAEKASELLKYDKPVYDAVDIYLRAVEKSTSKSAGPEEQQFVNKVKEARSRADSILSGI